MFSTEVSEYPFICTLGGFYRSRVFTSGNLHDIFFNVNAKKEKRLNVCS